MEDPCKSCRFYERPALDEPCLHCAHYPEAKHPSHWQPRVSIDDATPAEWDAASAAVNSIQPIHDPVQHPAHYTAGAIECIDYMEDVLSRDEFIGYLRGQVIKYQHRLMAKGNPAQDAGKLAWYAQRLASKLEAASE